MEHEVMVEGVAGAGRKWVQECGPKESWVLGFWPLPASGHTNFYLGLHLRHLLPFLCCIWSYSLALTTMIKWQQRWLVSMMGGAERKPQMCNVAVSHHYEYSRSGSVVQRSFSISPNWPFHIQYRQQISTTTSLQNKPFVWTILLWERDR